MYNTAVSCSEVFNWCLHRCGQKLFRNISTNIHLHFKTNLLQQILVPYPELLLPNAEVTWTHLYGKKNKKIKYIKCVLLYIFAQMELVDKGSNYLIHIFQNWDWFFFLLTMLTGYIKSRHIEETGLHVSDNTWISGISEKCSDLEWNGSEVWFFSSNGKEAFLLSLEIL